MLLRDANTKGEGVETVGMLLVRRWTATAGYRHPSLALYIKFSVTNAINDCRFLSTEINLLFMLRLHKYLSDAGSQIPSRDDFSA
jgi:hypothetical protein